MDIALALQAAKTVSSAVGSHYKNKSAKKIADIQKGTLEKYNQYNKEQLNKAYDKAISGTMTNYILNRMNITDEYNKMQTDLNIMASQSGINLTDSSFTGDAQSQLDMEFSNNLQNNYGNLISKMADLSLNKTSTELQLGLNYNNQIKQIQDTYNAVKENNINGLVKNAMEFGEKGFEDYSAWSSKRKLKEESSSVKDYLSNEFFNWKW